MSAGKSLHTNQSILRTFGRRLICICWSSTINKTLVRGLGGGGNWFLSPGCGSLSCILIGQIAISAFLWLTSQTFYFAIHKRLPIQVNIEALDSSFATTTKNQNLWNLQESPFNVV